MLNDLLNTLPGLLTRRFLLAGLLPLSLFLFGNAIMLYLYSAWGQATFQTLLTLEGGKFWLLVTGGGIALIATTFIYDSLLRGVGRWLEGVRVWRWLRSWILADRQAKFLAAESKLHELRASRRKIDTDDLKRQMRDARSKGRRKPCHYSATHATHKLINDLESREFETEPLGDPELLQAVSTMATTLSQCNANNPNNADSRRLDHDQTRLARIIDTACRRHDDRIREMHLELKRKFPVQPVVTDFGQVAASIGSYAYSRYGIMDFLWPRLQRVMQSDDAFSEMLQEAKTRVDFFVSLLAVTSIFTLTWLATVSLIGHEAIVVFLFGTIGPMFCWIWYRLAISSYRVFVEVAHSGVDLHRLTLLDTFKIKQPTNLGEEKIAWDRISRHIGFGEAHSLDYLDP